MTHLLVLTAIGCLIAGTAISNGSAQDIPLPQEWDTFFVWFLVANPDYIPAAQEEEQALTLAHIQYQLRLQETGQSLAAGGLGQGHEDSIIGLTILRADSLSEAQTLAEADPAVRAGRFLSWVREWWIPAGRLPAR